MTADAEETAQDLAKRAALLVDMSKEEWMRQRAEAQQRAAVTTHRPLLIAPPLYFSTRRSTYSDVVSVITTTRPVGSQGFDPPSLGGSRAPGKKARSRLPAGPGGPDATHGSPLRHTAAREHLELSRQHEALAAENQRFMGHLEEKRRTRMELETHAATVLQKLWRGFRLRKVVDTVKEQMLLQRRIRRSLRAATDGLDLVIDSRDEELRQRKRERSAARSIQAAFRGLLGRRLGKRERAIFRTQERATAAATMQSLVRLRTATVAADKLRLRHYQLQVREATTRIQACYRGYHGRQTARIRRLQLELVCVILIQRAVRRMLAVRACTAEKRRRQQEAAQLATIAIQRVFRGRKGRKQVCGLRDQEQTILREACALTVQRVYRGHLCRRLVRAERKRVVQEERLRAALTIQRVLRAMAGRQRFQMELVRQQEDLFTQTRLGKSQEVEDLFLGYTTEQEHSPTDVDRNGNTILLIAARWGHKKILRKCLRWRFNIDHRNNKNETALELAIRFSHGEVAQYLLSKKAELELHGRTLLHLAARNGLADVCEVLMNRGIKPNERDGDERTPVHEACCSDDLPTLQKLLELTSDVNLQDKTGGTPLHLAAMNGRNAFVTALIESGADVSVVDKQDRTPWRCALVEGHEATATLLRQQWAAIAGSVSLVTDRDRADVLVFAAQGKAALVGEIVDAGLDIDFKDGEGNTLLLLAAAGAHLSLLMECLRRSATVSACNNKGQTALHLAAMADLGVRARAAEAGESKKEAPKEGKEATKEEKEAMAIARVEVCDVLLEQGLTLTVADNAGRTPLHEGASKGVAFADAVREGSLSLNIPDATGRCPVHDAVAAGQSAEFLSSLVELGADVSVVDEKGRTPLHFAAGLKDGDAVVSVLLSSGALASLADADGNTPVHAAATAGEKASLELLLKADGDANACNGEGQSPGLMAARAGSVVCLELLMDHGADLALADSKGGTMLYAAICGKHDAAVAFLLNRGSSIVETYGENADTPLHLIARSNYRAAVPMLLGAADRPEALLERRNALGETVLMTAIDMGLETIVSDLLAVGVSTAPGLPQRQTLLHFAAAATVKSSGVIALLVNVGVDVASKDANGLTALHTAAATGMDDAQNVSALLQNGAGVDERDGSNESKTPLHHAAVAGALAAVQVLLEAGADKASTFLDAEGDPVTAATAASRAGFAEVAAALA